LLIYGISLTGIENLCGIISFAALIKKEDDSIGKKNENYGW